VEVEPQRRIEDGGGRFVARADLWVVGTRRLHEYDGEVHRERDTHRADLTRDRRLVEDGWQRLGWTAAEVLQGGPVIASLDALLGRPWRSRRLRLWRSWVAASSWRTNR
jgi:very-short-patch-repair endonuclease